MPINPATGEWFHRVSPKQVEIMQECRKPDGMQKFIFVNGPKQTSKTRGCLECVVDHAWNTNGARIAIIVQNIGAGDDSGIWTELTKVTIPDWISGDFGFEWIPFGAGKKRTGPRQKGASKKLYCEVRNKFGTISTIELNSMKEERDVEDNFFNRYFSMIYWCEAHQYTDPNTFKTLTQSLRVPSIPEEQHVLLMDGNPSDLGEDAWQYKLFFEDRINPDLEPEKKAQQKQLRLIIVTMDDNPFLSEEKKAQIRANYADDPDLYARYVLGQWKKSSTSSLFAGAFKPAKSVISLDSDGNAVELVPETDCIKLITGWDPGGANPSMVIAEKIFKQVKIRDIWREEAAFKFIDELVYTKADLSIAEFTALAMEKIKKWEAFIGRPMQWQHWSDNTAFTQKESISKRTVYQEVYKESGGDIELEASDSEYRFGKGVPMNRPGTVAQGIRLWRKLLFQERIYICERKCPKLVEMCKSLKRKPKTTADVVAENDKNRHIFDAARYLVARECYDELAEAVAEIQNANTAPAGIISVSL